MVSYHKFNSTDPNKIFHLYLDKSVTILKKQEIGYFSSKFQVG